MTWRQGFSQRVYNGSSWGPAVPDNIDIDTGEDHEQLFFKTAFSVLEEGRGKNLKVTTPWPNPCSKRLVDSAEGTKETVHK